MKAIPLKWLPRARILTAFLVLFLILTVLQVANIIMTARSFDRRNAAIMTDIDALRRSVITTIYLGNDFHIENAKPEFSRFQKLYGDAQKNIAVIEKQIKSLHWTGSEKHHQGSLAKLAEVRQLIEQQSSTIALMEDQYTRNDLVTFKETARAQHRNNRNLTQAVNQFVIILTREGNDDIDGTLAMGLWFVGVFFILMVAVFFLLIRFYRQLLAAGSQDTFYRFVIEGIRDGLWSWEIEENSVYFSARWFSMLGYGPEELPMEFSTWEQLLHPDDLPGALRVVQDFLATWKMNDSPAYNVEFRMRCRDGSWLWVAARGSIIETTDEGKPRVLAGTHTDISQTRAYEDELRRQKEEFEFLFRETTNATAIHRVVTDEMGNPVDFVYLNVNPAWEKMTGIGADRAIGKSYIELFGDPASEWIVLFGNVAVNGTPVSVMKYSPEVDRYLDIHVYRPRQGQFAVTFIDITEVKKSEERLRHRLDALTRPPLKSVGVGLEDLFTIDDLQKMQDAFSRANGVSSLIVDNDGRMVTRPSGMTTFCIGYGCGGNNTVELSCGGECYYGGGENTPTIGSCKLTGLLTAYAPVMAGDARVGTWYIGQVRPADVPIDFILDRMQVRGEGRKNAALNLESVAVMERHRFINICLSLFEISRQMSVLALGNLQQAQDIAVRQEAEKNIAFAQQVIEKAQDQIWYISRDGSILYVNNEVCRSLGYTREEVTALTIDAIRHGSKERLGWHEVWDRIVREKGALHEDTHLRKDGTVYPVEIVASLVPYGETEVMCAFVRDISVRKEAEKEITRKNDELEATNEELSATVEELEATNEEFEAINQELIEAQNDLLESRSLIRKTSTYLDNIINAMPSVIIGLRSDGIITHWNGAAQVLTRKSAGEVLGKDFSSTFSVLSDYHTDILYAVFNEEKLFIPRIEEEIEGVKRIVSVMVFPIQSEDLKGGVIRIDDNTERSRIDEVMVQTEKMMSVGGLAAGMAHEINNPLGIILQGVQSFYRRLDPSFHANVVAAQTAGVNLASINSYLRSRNIYDYMEGIQSAAERAAAIVANMLNFSRQSGAQFSLVSLNSLIDAVIEIASNDYDLKKQHDFKYIAIERDFAPDLPEISCVPTEIEQVLLNLIKNAAYAVFKMKEKNPGLEPKIEISTERDGDQIIVRVIDNGIGMDEATRKRVFEPFFTTKPVGAGTGLGLSVSYFIITSNHHGMIEVLSEPDAGSEFRIILPVK